MHTFSWSAAILLLLSLLVVRADAEDHGPTLGEPFTVRLQIGIEVSAPNGPCRGIVGTAPVPMDWPEQTVRVVDEQISPQVKKVSYRVLDKTARQMVVEIPRLAAGEQAKALVTFEVSRRPLLSPTETESLVLPKKLDQQLRTYLTDSPYIESRHPKVRALAAEAATMQTGAWSKVEALYDVSRAKVTYKEGDIRGALKALEDGEGDCEDISSLFIAMCRASGIPARTVWVPGHCYPEFYLEDEQGRGYWFPCQAAGDRSFGGIPELRPVLQKGDDFRIPPQRTRQRYVMEQLIAAGGQPSVRFIQQPVGMP